MAKMQSAYRPRRRTFSFCEKAVAATLGLNNTWDERKNVLRLQAENGGFEGCAVRALKGSLDYSYLHQGHVRALRDGKFVKVSELVSGDVFYISSVGFTDLHYEGGYSADLRCHLGDYREEIPGRPQVRVIWHPNKEHIIGLEYLGPTPLSW